MFWKKKNNTAVTNAVQPEEIQKNSFFSTDWMPEAHKVKREITLREKMKITFQRDFTAIKSVNSSGQHISPAFAMDSIDDMQQSKIISARPPGIPDAQLSWYAGQGFIGYQTCAMLSQNWLIDKACTMPAEDAARHNYEITINDGTEVSQEVLEEIRKKDKAFKIIPQCVELARMCRVFGIRVALFEVNSPDPKYYENPFNIDGITPDSYRGISQIDPYWMAPELSSIAASNPAAKDFYEPTWWLINGKRVHRSHLVVVRTGELPDILKPSYIFGGISIPQKIAERVYAAERTANEAPMLAMTKRLTTLNTDVTQAVDNPDAFSAKMTIWTEFMNNFGVKVIGEADKIEQHDTSLADLDAVIMTQYQLVAAAAEVPATKLLGTSPKGFNATGEFEESSYHEKLESIQQHWLSPLVDRHHALLMRSHIMPKFNTAPFEINHKWNAVDSPTAAEISDINLKKAQTDKLYVDAGAINGVDVRNRLIGDNDSGYNGIEAVEEPFNEGGEEENYEVTQ